MGDVNATIYQYSLSTPWDISTASYDSKSKDVSSEDAYPYGLFFKPDGNKVYVMGTDTATIYQYSLSGDYYSQWIIGRVDNYSLVTIAGQETCNIMGRDFMRTVLDYKLYSPNTYWGTTQTFNTVNGTADYSMHATCTGLYIAYLDSISPYDGSHLTPIYDGFDFGYTGATNKFSFLADKIPDYNGSSNLVVYYYQVQSIEDVVGHILYLAGIFATTGARDTWIANANYVTPTGIEIDRVWFNTGTSAFEAIRLLAEVAQYRFYFDYSGNPIFKPKASIGDSVDTFSDDCITNQEVEEDVEEVYNHIIVIGETRETLGQENCYE